MYLFEYSFGFYLINKIKFFKTNNNNWIPTRHFSENLMWFDVLKTQSET